MTYLLIQKEEIEKKIKRLESAKNELAHQSGIESELLMNFVAGQITELESVQKSSTPLLTQGVEERAEVYGREMASKLFDRNSQLWKIRAETEKKTYIKIATEQATLSRIKMEKLLDYARENYTLTHDDKWYHGQVFSSSDLLTEFEKTIEQSEIDSEEEKRQERFKRSNDIANPDNF